MIAVTGATGGVGGRVAQALASQGLALRLVVRDAARAPDWGIEGWVTSYAALPAGDLEPPSDTVQQILGRPPRSLADVLREQPGRLDHLRR